MSNQEHLLVRNENEFDEKKDSEARACQGRSSFQKNRAQKREVKGYGAEVTVLLEQRTNPKGAGFAGGLVGLLHRPLSQVRGSDPGLSAHAWSGGHVPTYLCVAPRPRAGAQGAGKGSRRESW